MNTNRFVVRSAGRYTVTYDRVAQTASISWGNDKQSNPLEWHEIVRFADIFQMCKQDAEAYQPLLEALEEGKMLVYRVSQEEKWTIIQNTVQLNKAVHLRKVKRGIASSRWYDSLQECLADNNLLPKHLTIAGEKGE